MLIIISPAKKLDFIKKAPIDNFSMPIFLDKTQLLINDLKKCKPIQISKLMKLSKSLTQLNVDRYKKFKMPFTLENAKQAIYAFKGDTYVGFGAETLTTQQINNAQKHLRILSGLYGLISPLDLIQPYRLEMGTRFSCKGSRNLYDFWSNELTSNLNQILKKEKILINLASKEYFSVLNFSKIATNVITPIFKEKKDDQLKVVGLFAKRARGKMARYIIDNKIKESEDLKQFDLDGYRFSKKLSSETEFIFTRSKK